MRAQRDAARLAAAISGEDLRKGGSIEIVLAKIVCLRYIGLSFFIRYVSDRIALACEDISKTRYPFGCCRSCLSRSWPGEC
jgi:hypothetical protein